MATAIPTTSTNSPEEWPDTDFDIPSDQPLHAAVCGKDNDEEDWDLDLDIGHQLVPKPKPSSAGITAKPSGSSQIFTIRPPITVELDDVDDDEGVSTIKVNALPKRVVPTPTSLATIDDDVESAFSLPEDLTQLSLVPLSLNHRSSKTSLEWGDRDHTSSSHSSDTYSLLGLGDGFPSSNSASSASSINLPDSDDDEDALELDGLVIPSGLFESGQSGRKLNKILEHKKKAPIYGDQIKVVDPNPDDDFEIGLIIEDDVDLNASRLLKNTQSKLKQPEFNRSNSAPLRSSSGLRPPSRTKNETRAKSPICPQSSSSHLRKLRLSPSPPLPTLHQTKSQTFQTFSVDPLASQSPSSFLSPKPGSLRGQKSHSGFKPPTPPASQRKLIRKASLSFPIEVGQAQASGSGLASLELPLAGQVSRYEAPTAASRARTHKNPSTSRIHAPEFVVPPTRPSTPSANPAALRLTMPTSTRQKSRPALSNVFTPTVTTPADNNFPNVPSPVLARPPSSLSLRTKKTKRLPSGPPPPPVPTVMRKPKHARTYGDGTELDGFEDLPADRDKEGLFRVQPKGFGNRIPGGSYPTKISEKEKDKGTIRRKGKREGSSGSGDIVTATLPPTNTLKRTGRIDISSLKSMPSEASLKKKRLGSPPTTQTMRKPTLIRNLNGTTAPKVVGDMKWNPQSLRWEGNDHILKDFDTAIGTSTRLGLITQLTSSSVAGSPVGTFGPGARVVGNMIFDPTRMCWVSILPPEEEEPDVFAELVEDEDDTASWDIRSGTIRSSLPGTVSSTESSIVSSSEAPSPTHARARAASESGSDRGSRASMVVCDVDDSFLAGCRAAEERNRSEMKGWRTRTRQAPEVLAEPDRSYLYEIRALATRKY